jgi:hypothetical protein
MSSQKGCGKKVATEKAVWIGSDDTGKSASSVVTEEGTKSSRSGTMFRRCGNLPLVAVCECSRDEDTDRRGDDCDRMLVDELNA